MNRKWLKIGRVAGFGLLVGLAGCAAEPEQAKQAAIPRPVAPAPQSAAPTNVEQAAIQTLQEGRKQDAKVIQDAQNAANILHR